MRYPEFYEKELKKVIRNNPRRTVFRASRGRIKTGEPFEVLRGIVTRIDICDVYEGLAEIAEREAKGKLCFDVFAGTNIVPTLLYLKNGAKGVSIIEADDKCIRTYAYFLLIFGIIVEVLGDEAGKYIGYFNDRNLLKRFKDALECIPLENRRNVADKLVWLYVADEICEKRLFRLHNSLANSQPYLDEYLARLGVFPLSSLNSTRKKELRNPSKEKPFTYYEVFPSCATEDILGEFRNQNCFLSSVLSLTYLDAYKGKGRRGIPARRIIYPSNDRKKFLSIIRELKEGGWGVYFQENKRQDILDVLREVVLEEGRGGYVVRFPIKKWGPGRIKTPYRIAKKKIVPDRRLRWIYI